MKVVLDTNVLMSAIFFGGAPGQIIKAWRNRKIQLVVSPAIIDEYLRVLSRDTIPNLLILILPRISPRKESTKAGVRSCINTFAFRGTSSGKRF